MKHAVEIVQPGVANTVQDGGRRGFRRFGVPLSGASDPVLLACANGLLGNAPDSAAIELPLAGPSLRATDGPVRLALAGTAAAKLLRADGSQLDIGSAQTVTLRRGDSLSVGAVRSGVAYLALAGGCRVPPQLGSRSTYARARLGGVAGRALAAGDRIECGAPSGDIGLEWRASAPFVHDDGPIRVLPGPQDDAFAPEALATLTSRPYRVGRDSDRMGLRLEGPVLAHRGSADIVSDGIAPGAIQVPGNGQPIVLLADAQTVGGYTKIATVIRADLPRMAHARPGTELRFAVVTRELAFAALRAQAQALERWLRAIVSYRLPGSLDLDALRENNLVSGVLDAATGRLPWESE
jgi:5-oxoprolinase (ATP-hydrolysing) subunit C